MNAVFDMDTPTGPGALLLRHPRPDRAAHPERPVPDLVNDLYDFDGLRAPPGRVARAALWLMEAVRSRHVRGNAPEAPTHVVSSVPRAGRRRAVSVRHESVASCAGEAGSSGTGGSSGAGAGPGGASGTTGAAGSGGDDRRRGHHGQRGHDRRGRLGHDGAAQAAARHGCARRGRQRRDHGRGRRERAGRRRGTRRRGRQRRAAPARPAPPVPAPPAARGSTGAGNNTGGNGFYRLERLNRGVVAVTVSGGVYVGWRMFGFEYDSANAANVSYNVYRNGTMVANVTNSTNYLDSGGSASATYTVRAVIGGTVGADSEIRHGVGAAVPAHPADGPGGRHHAVVVPDGQRGLHLQRQRRQRRRPRRRRPLRDHPQVGSVEREGQLPGRLHRQRLHRRLHADGHPAVADRPRAATSAPARTTRSSSSSTPTATARRRWR